MDDNGNADNQRRGGNGDSDVASGEFLVEVNRSDNLVEEYLIVKMESSGRFRIMVGPQADAGVIERG